MNRKKLKRHVKFGDDEDSDADEKKEDREDDDKEKKRGCCTPWEATRIPSYDQHINGLVCVYYV